jgi:hypothetical protein
MTKTQPAPTPTQTRWSQHIAAWEFSDLSQANFCQLHQLVYGTFVYWRHRLKKLNADKTPECAISFLPVTLNPVKSKVLVLHINDRHSVELDADFDLALLNQVIRALEPGELFALSQSLFVRIQLF